MLQTVELSTAKYFNQVTRQEISAGKRARNRKARSDFSTFLLGLLAIQIGVWTVKAMPQWLPALKALLQSYGIEL